MHRESERLCCKYLILSKSRLLASSHSFKRHFRTGGNNDLPHDNNATGSGMGTAGLVGQIMTWQTMIQQTEPAATVLIKIFIIQIILPAIITLGISEYMRKKGWIKNGDMKLDV